MTRHLLREIGSNVQYMYSAVQDLRNDLDTKLATKDHVQDTYCAVQGLRGDIDTNFAALTPGRVEEEGRRIGENRYFHQMSSNAMMPFFAHFA